MTLKIKIYRVKENANFTNMSPDRYGETYPAPHRGETGQVVDYFDDMPVLKFSDGDEEQYPLSSLEEVE